MLAKRIGNITRAGALGDRTPPHTHTHPASISSAGSPNSSPCLHSCILLAFFPQLCCQVHIFPLPPSSPFLGTWKSKVFVYLSLRTWPLSALPGETLEHLAELTLRSWSVYSGTPPRPPMLPPPVPGHEQSYSTTTYSTGLCAKWFIYIISLYLQTTLGKRILPFIQV